MNNNHPLIKKFKTDKNFYIYDTWTNEILKVQKAFWDYFDDGENLSPNKSDLRKIPNFDEIEKDVSKAKEKGFLSTDRPMVKTYYGWENWKEQIEYKLKHEMKNVTLNVSDNCNFRCAYCPYTGNSNNFRRHSSKQMSWSIARKSIEYVIKHSDLYRKDENKPLHVTFYGGEPLFNFKLIKKSVLFCKCNYPDVNFNFLSVTNGSLINQEIADFFVENDITTDFSIDGPAHLHNRYRKTNNNEPTHEMVMKSFRLMKKTASQKRKDLIIGVNCVLTPPYDLYSIYNFFNKINQTAQISQASDSNPTFYKRFNMIKEYQKYEHQINYFYEIYKNDLIRENPKKNWVGNHIFGEGLNVIAKRKMVKMENKFSSQGQCIPGKVKLFVSCDGDFYPCEKVSQQYNIGDIHIGLDLNKIYKFLKEWSNLFSDICNNCWALRLCQKCFSEFDPSNQFKNNSLHKFCEDRKNYIEKNLKNYCSILELNSNSLEFMKKKL